MNTIGIGNETNRITSFLIQNINLGTMRYVNLSVVHRNMIPATRACNVISVNNFVFILSVAGRTAKSKNEKLIFFMAINYRAR